MIRALLLCGAALLLSACSGDPLGRHAISGNVKVDGKPLAKGNINFWPVDGQATSGGGEVIDGKFSVAKASGLVNGKYRVVVNAAIPGSAGQPDASALPGDIPPPPKEMIPPEWNSASTQTIEVQPKGPFEFDFEISTKSTGAKAKL